MVHPVSMLQIIRIVGIFVWAPFEMGETGGLCKVLLAVMLVTRSHWSIQKIRFVRYAS
jgi:hypothetical protein